MSKKTLTRKILDTINAVEDFNPAELAVKLEGQLHLPVKDRISWFKLVHPSGAIVPAPPVFLPELNAWLVHAEVFDETGKLLSSGNGTASYHDKDGFGLHPIECAETKAIGRALAAAGFGNQFSGDDYVQKEPIDMGVSENGEKEESSDDLFEDASLHNKNFENKVSKLMEAYTPEMSKGIVISYGPCATKTIADIYKESKKLDTLKKYAFPETADMEHAAQIAACRVFIKAVEESKK